MEISHDVPIAPVIDEIYDAYSDHDDQKTFIINDFDSMQSNNFYVHGINYSDFIPRYYVHSTKELKNGGIRYHLVRKSGKTLFINALYETMYNFMKYIGYNPDETFEYVQVTDSKNRRKDGGFHLQSKLYKRLIIKKEHVPYRGYFLDYYSLHARFQSNIDYLDLGFALHCYARTVDIDILPHINLIDKAKKKMSPCAFFRNFLLTANYPIILYNYSQKIGTNGRLISAYRDMQSNRGKYQKWSFDPQNLKEMI